MQMEGWVMLYSPHNMAWVSQEKDFAGISQNIVMNSGQVSNIYIKTQNKTIKCLHWSLDMPSCLKKTHRWHVLSLAVHFDLQPLKLLLCSQTIKVSAAEWMVLELELELINTECEILLLQGFQRRREKRRWKRWSVWRLKYLRGRVNCRKVPITVLSGEVHYKLQCTAHSYVETKEILTICRVN